MKLFNSIQLVTLFAAFPILLEYLSRAAFNYATFLFYVGCAAYFVMFCWFIAIFYKNVE